MVRIISNQVDFSKRLLTYVVEHTCRRCRKSFIKPNTYRMSSSANKYGVYICVSCPLCNVSSNVIHAKPPLWFEPVDIPSAKVGKIVWV